MGFKTKKVASDGGPGVEVCDLDIEDLAHESVRKDLVDLWIDVGVVVFRGMRGDVDTHLALSRCFGELRDHPVRESWVDGHPELIHVDYRPTDGDVYEIDGERRGAWLPWHSDLIYMDKINRGGILRPIELPASGGETGFVDRIAAYQRLPADLRRQIEDLHVVYHFNVNAEQQKFGRAPNLRKVQDSRSYRSIQSRMSDFSKPIHPMVYEQPDTGRQVLNVSPWFARGIHEMPGPEGDALLSQIVEYCTDERYAYFHSWRPDDMVLWDNWRVLHSSRGCPWQSTRRMQRTTFVGDYALGALS
jgi:taurine dioxygenase